jgi:hypothetical protein
MEDLMQKIQFNNIVNEKISKLEEKIDTLKEEIENKVSSKGGGDKHIRKLTRESEKENSEEKNQLKKIYEEMEELRRQNKKVRLNEIFVPNKPAHIEKYAPHNSYNSFTSNVDENIVNDIMLCHGIHDDFKILLMMGIGVFMKNPNIQYMEIMKRLADMQKLFLIIASSDYIYGTNYQFCHSYLGKDLNLTQEKIIQAMGRVGRNNIQQNYSIRFRDDSLIQKIFLPEINKIEVINMNKLFVST